MLDPDSSDSESEDETEIGVSLDEFMEENQRNLDPLDRVQAYEDEELGTLLMAMEGEPPEEYDFKTINKTTCIPGFSPSAPPGPTLREPLESALDYFQLFFSDPYLQSVCFLTNKYAATRREDGDRGKWTPLLLDELKAYFGVWIIIEKFLKERVEQLWSKGDDFLLNVPGISEVFTRDRYAQITRYLHFCNEDHALPRAHADYDKLYKVRPMLSHLQNVFQAHYVPDREMSVDECMVPFHGRLAFKQYIREKPIKWGIKVFILAESKTGYNYNFEVYSGKDTAFGYMLKMGLGQRIVVSLTKPIHTFGYHIYFDRFFTSPCLLASLLAVGTLGCGTVMLHRLGFPKELKKGPRDMVRGECEWRLCHKTGILATVWCDKKPIYFLSTAHIAEKDNTYVTRKEGGKRVQVLSCPSVVEYNKYMVGVDLNDKMATLDRSRRTYKWYRRLVRKGMMWALYNGFVIEGYFVTHNALNQRRRDFRGYIIEVAHQLVGKYRRATVCFAKRVVTSNRLTDEDHTPIVGEGKDHVCVVCQEKFTRYMKCNPDHHYSDVPAECRRRKTIFKCKSQFCNVYLCIKPDSNCWYHWHHMVEYWR